MKRTHALIAVLALMSMTTVAQAAVAENQGIQEQGRSSMLELAVDAQPMIPAQWREDRFEAAGAGDHGLRQQHHQATIQDMIPAQWREDRFEAAGAGDDVFRQQQQATTQDMIPAQWREDRFEAAGAGDDGIRKQG